MRSETIEVLTGLIENVNVFVVVILIVIVVVVVVVDVVDEKNESTTVERLMFENKLLRTKLEDTSLQIDKEFHDAWRLTLKGAIGLIIRRIRQLEVFIRENNLTVPKMHNT